MENIFVDTNIVLDLIQKREFYADAQQLFTMADRAEVKLYISALTLANIHYILYKNLKMEARKVLAKFKVLVQVLAIDDKIINLALASDLKDFEDAIQYYTAIENNLDLLITRNGKDFKNSIIPILTAGQYLNR